MGVAREEGCRCRGVLDTCAYCAQVRGQEALARLVAGDPFVEGGTGGTDGEGGRGSPKMIAGEDAPRRSQTSP
jgi:hypothetical protein